MKLRKMAMAAGSVLVGAKLGSMVGRTLKRALKPQTQHGHNALVGRECVITTLEVSQTFGQARCEDGGAGLLLSVRCQQENDLTRGRVARVVAYHEGSDTYEVAPL